MDKIRDLVKSAMGYDDARHDQVQVTNMPFAKMDVGDVTPAAKPLLGLEPAYWFKIIEAAIMCVTALLIGLFVARPLINRMFTAGSPASQPGQIANASPVVGALPAPGTATAGDAGAAQGALPAPGPAIDISRIEGQVNQSSVKKIGEVVNSHPEEALAIIRTWLHQPV